MKLEDMLMFCQTRKVGLGSPFSETHIHQNGSSLQHALSSYFNP